jgi:GNAT superfamily N-acetyltransferase
MNVQRGAYTISTDPARLQPEAIVAVLARMYWSSGRSAERVVRSLEGSLCFGVYHEEAQVGLARVITDRATFALLCDVYILEAHRGHGLGKWLMEAVVSYPDFQGIRRLLLATKDAHGLYAQFGFAPLNAPERWMERFDPNA